MSDKKVCFVDFLTKQRVKQTSDDPKITSESMGDMSGMHGGALPTTFSQNVINTTQVATTNDTKKQNRRKAPKNKMSLSNWLQWSQRAEDEEEYEDDMFSDDEYDDEYSELDFDDDNYRERDLDREFTNFDDDEYDDEYDDYDDDYDDEYDDFDDIANKVIDGISDDIIDKIDDVTSDITKWWREQKVNQKTNDIDFEDEEDLDDNVLSYHERNYERDRDIDEFLQKDDEYEEEQEAQAGPPKIDRARMVFQRMINQPNTTRSDIIDAFVNEVDVTQSTAVSYYERLAKEAGLTGDDEGDQFANREPTPQRPEQQPPVERLPADKDLDFEEDPEISGDPDRQGIIRTVDDAHLVYKRQNDEGTFDELWVYNIGGTVDDELKVRRAILAGTDISQSRTQSEDGSQSYNLSTMGNAQLLHITGLPN